MWSQCSPTCEPGFTAPAATIQLHRLSPSEMTAIRPTGLPRTARVTAHILSSPKQLNIRTTVMRLRRGDKHNLTDAHFIYAVRHGTYFNTILPLVFDAADVK